MLNPQAESQTLYVNNLDDRKNPEVLKKALKEVCGAYGELHDIVCMKSMKRRGQAWVVYKSIESARDAKESLQNFPLFNKPMRIAFAKTKSDVIAKEDGTFVPRPKNNLKQDPTKRDAQKRKEEAERQAREAAAAGSGVVPGQLGSTLQFFNQPQQSAASNFFNMQAPQMPMQQAQLGSMYPNETLFAINLPREANEQMLRMLFSQYQGFKEVRHIESRQCAFIEYISEPYATLALRALSTFEIRPGQKLQLVYMRK